MDKAEKKNAWAISSSIRKSRTTPLGRDRIEHYNEVDTKLTLRSSSPKQSTCRRLLFRGRYSKAVVGPGGWSDTTDTHYLTELSEAWQALGLHYIRQLDHLCTTRRATFMRISVFRADRSARLVLRPGR